MTAPQRNWHPTVSQSLNHTLTSSPESDKPSQFVSPTATQHPASMLVASALILPAPDITSFMSLSGTTPSSISSLTNSDSESLAGQTSVRSDCQLKPQLPMSYNKMTLRDLNGRPQVQTFNTLLPPLPDDATASLTSGIRGKSHHQAIQPHKP